MNFLVRLIRFLFGLESANPSTTANPTPGFDRWNPGSRILILSTPDGETTDLPPASADPYFAAIDPASKFKMSAGFDAASPFAPIARDEVREAADGGGLLSNFWFGRRDLIPPISDPRTLLIDRAMVTEGLLSPEQLAEIHDVGDRMAEVKARLETAKRLTKAVGDAAVIADREQLALLKAQKKAEALKRKQERREAVEHRKATRIDYLGRGVGSRLGRHEADLDRLAAAGLPIVHDPKEIADFLKISISRLRWLAFHNEVAARTHYVQFEVPKKSGGTRTLSAPHRSLAQAQRWIFEEILSKLPVEDQAHGFVTQRGIVTNALPHCRRSVVVNLDLEGFFPSIGFPRVRSVFQRLGYSPAVSTVLALLCTECPRQRVVYDGTPYQVAIGPLGLPQGACTSPALSNQVAKRLDKRLNGLAVKAGLTYTRYADDLTFSGGEPLESRVGRLLARVRHIAESEGFKVNVKKTRVLRQNTAQVVTGLVVNDRPGVARDEVRKLRAILHRAKIEGLDAQNRDGHPHFEAWLRGKIGFVGMARPEVGARLNAALAELIGK